MPDKLSILSHLPEPSQVLEFHTRLPQGRTDHERTTLQRQITATDRQIDQLVYQLYGLTDEEIAIVEEATK